MDDVASVQLTEREFANGRMADTDLTVLVRALGVCSSWPTAPVPAQDSELRRILGDSGAPSEHRGHVHVARQPSSLRSPSAYIAVPLSRSRSPACDINPASSDANAQGRPIRDGGRRAAATGGIVAMLVGGGATGRPLVATLKRSPLGLTGLCLNDNRYSFVLVRHPC